MLSRIRSIVPPLTASLRKGQMGRIGVLGGSLEYTGAPYFAAIAALRAGADLVHVFCTHDAAPVIKGYSPELIVHPLPQYDATLSDYSYHALAAIHPWLDRLDALIIGPGMGRDVRLQTLAKIIANDLSEGTALVVDADGLQALVVNGLLPIRFKQGPLFLTPNGGEFLRMRQSETETVAQMAQRLNATVLVKGAIDEFSSPTGIVEHCDTTGALRRCGGQGDLLSGLVALFAVWSRLTHPTQDEEKRSLTVCLAASHVTRTAARLAFEKHGRAMGPHHVLDQIPYAFRSEMELL